MKKIISLLLVLTLVLAGCGSSTDKKEEISEQREMVTEEAKVTEKLTEKEESVEKEEPEETEEQKEPIELKVIAPYGTPTLSMVKMFVENPEIQEGVTVSYEPIQATDVLTASLINQDADIAIVPTNLAAVMHSKNVGYKIAASTIWGVLYVASNEEITSVEDLRGKTMTVIGRNLTPDAMLRYVLQENGIHPDEDITLEYFTGASELASNYISGESNLAMIPQPVLTSVMMKREDTKVVLNLQEEWTKLTGLDRFPQASIIVSEELIANRPDVVDAFLAEYEDSIKWLNENPAEGGTYYESLGIGLKAKIVEKALPSCNMKYVAAKDAEEALDKYLDTLFEFNPSLTGGKAVDESLYYKK